MYSFKEGYVQLVELQFFNEDARKGTCNVGKITEILANHFEVELFCAKERFILRIKSKE